MSRSEWVETTASVYSCGWEDTPSRGFIFGTLSGFFSGQYLIVFSYTVDGNHYSGEFTSQEEWKEGATFSLKYNPRKPEENDRAAEIDGPVAKILSWVGAAAVVAIYIWWKRRN